MRNIPTQDREHCLTVHSHHLKERVYEERARAGHTQGMFLPEMVEEQRWVEVWALDVLAEEGFVFQQPLSLRWADSSGRFVDARPQEFVMDFYHPETGLRVEIDYGPDAEDADDPRWDQRIYNAVGIETHRVAASAIRQQHRYGTAANWYDGVLRRLDAFYAQQSA